MRSDLGARAPRSSRSCHRQDPRQSSWGEGPERDDRVPSLMQPTRDGGPTKKPPRPLSRVTREETPASQTHKFEPRAHRGGSAGGTWGPRELPGSPGEREPGLVDSGRSPLSVRLLGPGLRPGWPPPPTHGLMLKARAGVCPVLGSGAQSRPLDLGVPGGLWRGPRDAVQVSHFKHRCLPVDQAAPQAASQAC